MGFLFISEMQAGERNAQQLPGFRLPQAGFTLSDSVSNYHGKQVSCKNASDGTIDLTVTGGVSPFTFSWSNSSTTEDLSGLPAGSYQVFVTDSTGDLDSLTVLLNEPDSLYLNMVSLHSICDQPNGSLEAIATGGTPGFSFLWENGDSSPLHDSLLTGNYTVTVTDTNGCSFSSIYAVAGAGTPKIVLDSLFPVTCNGASTGSVFVSTTGGTSPYNFLWSDGSSLEDITGLPASVYTLTVTDQDGCADSASYAVSEPAAIGLSFSVNNPVCGNPNGTVTILATGGIPGYTYNWSTGSTNQTISSAGQGSYTVTVTDSAGCNMTGDTGLTDAGNPQITLSNQLQVDCHGSATGALDISVSAGTFPYSFAWSNGSTNEDIGGLTAGTYTVTVIDANGCSSSQFFPVTQPDSMVISLTGIDETCSNSNGQIAAAVSGGTGNYTYNWSTGAVTSQVSGLAAAVFSVTVTDSLNCTAMASVEIFNLPGPVVSLNQLIPVGCFGGADGAADIQVTGGASPFSFQWSGGNTLEDLAGVSSGTYTITVTDTNSCSAGFTVVIPEPGPIQLVPSSNPATCGNSNGNAVVIVSGGTPSYVFLWSDGSSLNPATSLPAGAYTVTVTDANNCTADTTISVLDLPAPVPVVNFISAVTCNGGNNGGVDISISSGNPAFTYLWSDGSTLQDIGNVSAGTFTVLITDAASCTATLTAMVTEPLPIGVSFTTSNATCGLSNGSALAGANGGTAPYTFLWSNGSSVDSISTVASGNYTVTVTDAASCSVTAVCSVNNIGGPTVSIGTITDVSCNGASTGAIDINLLNGTPPFQFLWSNGATTEDISGIASGNYQVTVTDSNGCVANKNIIVSQSPALFANLSAQDETCTLSNGSLTVIAGGGTGVLSYLWSQGGTTATISGLAAGSYMVTVTDANSCTVLASFNLINKAGPAITLDTALSVSCSGGNNGFIQVSLAGGTAPFSFLWSNGSTLEDPSGIPASTYTVTVTDDNSCTATLAAVITEPQAITSSLTVVPATCGLTNGSVSCLAGGGTPPLSYLWSNSASTAAISNLGPGTYTVTITDAHACSLSDVAAVQSLSAPVLAVLNVTDVLCNGNATGSVNLQVTVGNGPFLFSWSDGSTLEDPVNLATGTYTVSVTDVNSCTATQSAVVTEPAALQVTTTAGNANCNLPNGTAQVQASGGTGALSFLWSNGSTSQNQNGLASGIYTITVTDTHGCTIQDQAVVGLTTGLSAAATASGSVTCFGGADGFIDLTVSGGTAPFSYLWSNGATTEDLSGIPAGTYTVTVTDQDNCTTVSGEFIPQSTQLSSSFNIQNSLSGNPTGSIQAIPSGGSGNYIYLWSTGSVNSFISGLVAGTYTCTITDQSGCSRVFTPVVSNLTSACGVSVTQVTNVSCNGGNNGAIDITVTGGIPPFTYLWSNLATTEDISGLTAGTYTVTVTDSVLCIATETIVVSEPALLSVSITGTNGSCGNANGTATANPSGGNGGNSFLWSTGSTNASLSALGSGTYTVSVTDSKGCTASSSVSITVVSAPQIASGNVTNVSCSGGTDGAIDITVSNGTTPYTYSWSNAATVQDLTGLAFGTYTVTVTDSAGCQVSANYSVTQPNALSVSLNPVSSTCGNSNGIVSSSVSGGTGSYGYLWNNGATTANLNGVTAATYTVTVTDANSCTAISSALLQNIAGPSVSVTSQINVACNGGSNGSLNITVTSGTFPFTYLWSNGSSLEDISGMASGTYTVTVTDANNCTGTVSATITQPTAISASIAPVQATCGNANGSASVSASGGTGALSYLWSTGSTVTAITGLVPGTYTVTVTDASFCTQTATVALVNIAGPAVSVTSTDSVSCNGGSDGSVNITVSGGTAPFTYNWSNASSVQDPSGLTSGTYTVTVTDGNSCTATVSATVFQPVALTVSMNKTNASCGNANGSITASPSGGTGGYTYAWSGGATTASVTGLAPATYTVTVSDANGCTKTATSQIVNIAGPAVSLNAAANISCNGGNDGSVDITVSGGTAPFTYSWSSGDTIQDIAGLTAGTYTVTVADANGCTATLSAALTEPAAISISKNKVDATCGNSNGSASASASGGTGSFTYLWSNGATTSSVSGLAVNVYVVTATDANGCTRSTSVSISNAGAPAITFGSLTNISCNGGSNGSITVSVTGGTTPYTYSWSNGASTQNLTGLSAGNYTLILTDSNNCASAFDTLLTQPAVITVTIAKTNATCGNANGMLTASATGGTGAYGYSWSNGATSAALSGLAPGTYTVTVTDANSCTRTKTSSIGNIAGPSVSLNGSTNVSCNGGSNGSIDISVSGGTAPFTYLWSTTATTQDISALAAGTYTVTVTDGNGCTGTLSSAVTQPSMITIVLSKTNATCLQANGTATASPSGGTGAFTYLWSNGKTTATATGLAAGTYSVTVTDASGCTKTDVTSIFDNGMPAVSLVSLTPVTCNGGNNGAINISVTSGTSPYTYSWSNGATTQDINLLTAGPYTVMVTDTSGCTVVFDTLITQPPAITVNVAKTNASCGLANGILIASATGGQGSFSYLWSNGSVNDTTSSLSPGTYTVTVTDGSSCTKTATSSITNIAGPSVTLNLKTNVSCNGGNDGSININVSGGTSPYTYTWSNGQTTQDIDTLAAGTFTVTVTDAIGCTKTLSSTLNQPSAISISTSSVNATCGSANGSVNASPSGGTSPYTYLWSSGSTNASDSGLVAGSYTVTVTDSLGCTKTASVTVSNTGGPVVTLNTLTSPLCPGGSNGSITLTVTAGTTPYTYTWSNGKTSKNNTNIPAGTYTITVTDASGCIVNFDTTVTDPPAFLLSFANNDATCGGNNGVSTVSVSGGTPGYSLVWSNGKTTATNTSLGAGNYTVTVTDANGCTKTASTTITNTTNPSVLPDSIGNVSCFGGSDGQIYISVAGGTSPFTYAWSNGQSTQDISGLSSGTYTVTVTDSVGCIAVFSTPVTQPGQISLTLGNTSATCNQSDGSASVTATGGTGLLSYLWSNGVTTSSNPSIPGGTYSVTVTDANGCTKTGSTVVGNTNAPVISLVSLVPVTCFGGSSGDINISVTGGGSPYTYSWSNGKTSQDNFNVASGTYTVTVTAQDGCTSTSSYFVSQPAQLVINETVIPANCGNSNGGIAVLVTGGISPYTYSWSTGSTTDSIYGKPAGNYTIQVTDSNGCAKSKVIAISNLGGPVITTDSLADISCINGNDGYIFNTITSGTPPYTYVWSTGVTTDDLTGLTAGSYTITVTDSTNCITVKSFTLIEPAAITIFWNPQNPTCGNANGSVLINNITGGAGPYQFLWSNGNTTGGISGLLPGVYTLTVTDSRGCQKDSSVTLVDPGNPAITLDSIVQVKCNGGLTGAVFIQINGGYNNYTYNWSNGSTIQDLLNVLSGTYTVFVYDSVGCGDTASFFISQPLALSLTLTSLDATCGLANGSVSSSVSGGTLAYTYQWSNASTVSSISNLAPAVYSLTVTDAHGCTITRSDTVSNATGPVITVSSVIDVSCFGQSNGSVSITVTGGAIPLTYSWSNGSSSQNATTLPGGTYTVTVTDDNGCTSTATAIVNAPPQLTSQVFTTPSNCGSASGSATATAAGGNGGYTYVWNTGQTTGTLTGLLPAVYTVTVTDSKGCTSSASGTVTGTTAPVPAVLTVLNISCFGLSDGSIDIQVTSGLQPYSYLWSNGTTSEDNLQLGPGVYTVTVTDANGCTGTVSAQVSEPPVLAASLVITYASCTGSDGTAHVLPSGGTPAYSYVWSTGATTDSIGGLAAGTYTVTVSDFNGCTLDTIVQISNPSAPVISLDTAKNVTCFSGTDGFIEINLTGGSSPFSYLWSNGETSQDIQNLSANTYTVTVTDQFGCTTQYSYTVTQPGDIVIVVSTVPATCGSANGSACISISGGISPYNFIWSNGFTTTCIQNLTAGSYPVTVTDNNGCVKLDAANISNLAGPDVVVADSANVKCYNGSDGSINISVSAGNPPYTFFWSNGLTTEDITGLASGTYTVTVTDNAGCLAIYSTSLTQPSAITRFAVSPFLNDTFQVSCHGLADGSLDLTVSGGSPPYSYSWSNQAVTEDIDSLTAGVYTVIITDQNGCTVSSSYTLMEPPPLNAHAGSNFTICGVDSTALNADTLVSGLTGFWQVVAGSGVLTDSVSPSTIIHNLSNGNVQLNWILTDGICFDTSSITISVATEVKAIAGIDLSTCEDTARLTATPALFGYGFWTLVTGSGIIKDTLDPTTRVSHLEFGINTFQWVVVNGNCTDTDYVSIEVLDPATCLSDVFLPSGFSPNSDGKNDYFVIRGLDDYPDNSLTVYNRWGNLVYEKSGYDNRWNGTSNDGKQLPEGTYFIILKINSHPILIRGFVDLRR